MGKNYQRINIAGAIIDNEGGTFYKHIVEQENSDPNPN